MFYDPIVNWLSDNQEIADLVSIMLVLTAGFIGYVVAREYLLRALKRLTAMTETHIDNILVEKLGLTKVFFLIPVVMIYNFAYLFRDFEEVVLRLSMVLISIIFLMTIGVFLNAVDEIYQGTKFAKRTPIKSHLQIVKIFIYLVGTVTILGQLTGRSPWYFITGVGVFTAVVLMIFRDTILSFVASLQIASNDLFKEGDWIEVPSFGADGDVIDISLHTVRVQNWDKTITIIPTYKFLEISFKNWRGMQKSGGRRIKRAIHIDISSIRFCTEEMLERFRKIRYIQGYLDRKMEEIAAHNRELNVDLSSMVNRRQLTNVGTFRAYIDAYLRNHPKIHQGLTFLIRQLPPGADGLPIEIYVFTNDINWVNYEGIQADIFDHLLAAAQEFDLKVFQAPTGHDFSRLGISPAGPNQGS